MKQGVVGWTYLVQDERSWETGKGSNWRHGDGWQEEQVSLKLN